MSMMCVLCKALWALVMVQYTCRLFSILYMEASSKLKTTKLDTTCLPFVFVLLYPTGCLFLLFFTRNCSNFTLTVLKVSKMRNVCLQNKNSHQRSRAVPIRLRVSDVAAQAPAVPAPLALLLHFRPRVTFCHSV